MNKSDKLKAIILSKYKTLKEFSDYSGIPSSTLSSAFNRGIEGMAIEKVIKICDLLNIDIKTFEPIDTTPFEITLTPKHKKLILSYDKLDSHGKEMVDFVLEKEYLRSTAVKELPEENDNIIQLPFMLEKASAGTGYELSDDASEMIDVVFNRSTARADAIVQISGDSMLPKFSDGDKVLLQKMPDIDVGEIGLFVVNNCGYIKKRGEHELISLNPEYENIQLGEFDSVYCMGKVIDKFDDSWIR
ncbi:LexA repressor [Clostridiales bacterium]|nr:LexA repressor [Clostridiales bacterium]